MRNNVTWIINCRYRTRKYLQVYSIENRAVCNEGNRVISCSSNSGRCDNQPWRKRKIETRGRERETFLPTPVSRDSKSRVVPCVLCLRRYPVKTLTWVTRCSGSAHRSGGSPEAFIVLQVYYDRPGIGRPHRRPIRLPREWPPHFPSRLFARLPSAPPLGKQSPRIVLINRGKIGKFRSTRAIDTAVDTTIQW